MLSRTGETADEFAGTVVGLGALGIVTRLWLDVEPAYSVRQHVYDGLAHEQAVDHLDEILASGYSVSLFTRWQPPAPVYQVWRKLPGQHRYSPRRCPRRRGGRRPGQPGAGVLRCHRRAGVAASAAGHDR